MIKYFVHYGFENGFGRTCVLSNTPIRSIDDVSKIEKIISQADENVDKKICVTCWQRFEKESLIRRILFLLEKLFFSQVKTST